MPTLDRILRLNPMKYFILNTVDDGMDFHFYEHKREAIKDFDHIKKRAEELKLENHRILLKVLRK